MKVSLRMTYTILDSLFYVTIISHISAFGSCEDNNDHVLEECHYFINSMPYKIYGVKARAWLVHGERLISWDWI